MTRLRSPIGMYGGKGQMVARLLPLLPPCHTYVEPFGGGASILLARDPSPVEVYNDIDYGLYQFFSVLADGELFERFYRRVALLPYHRVLHDECRKTWEQQVDPVERAARWFVMARQMFGGYHTPSKSWSSVVTKSDRGMVSTASKWLSILEMLPEIHARLQRVQFERQDFRRILARYDTPGTLFYCDPPYLLATRQQKVYKHELSAAAHRDLTVRLLAVEGMVMLSGYPHRLYDEPLTAAGWDVTDFDLPCRAVNTTREQGRLGDGALSQHRRTERVWRNPAAMRRMR